MRVIPINFNMSDFRAMKDKSILTVKVYISKKSPFYLEQALVLNVRRSCHCNSLSSQNCITVSQVMGSIPWKYLFLSQEKFKKFGKF